MVNAYALRILGAAIACSMLFAAGCSKKNTLEKMEIRGKVTYNGQPLESGEIAFKPEKGSEVPPAAAVITRGEYEAKGRAGIAAGTYRVEVTGFKTETSPLEFDRPPPTPGVIPMGRANYLPEKFNTKTTLEKVTVKPGEKSLVRNFDLKD